MRIKTFLIPLIAFGTFFMSSCNKNAVNVTYTNAKGEVEQLANLVFRFNHSLAKDSMLNAWDSTEYISFNPEIPGKFRWAGPGELIFSPSQPLRPATKYTASIKNAVLRFSKYNSVKNGDNISFNTSGLEMGNTQVVWIGESSTDRSFF